MAACEAQEDIPPSSLLELGWQQGTIFSLPGANCVWTQVAGSAEDNVLAQGQRSIKNGEKLILVTQDCDILSDDEPRVEALLVRIKDKPKDARYLDRLVNSYREFVVDRHRGYVVDARYRILLGKEVLWQLTPDDWTMDDQVQDDFVDWLASRYARPPIPDDVHEAVCQPIRGELERLRADQPETFNTLNQAIRMLRIRLSPDSASLQVGILCVIDDEIGYEESLAIDSTMAELKRIVEQGHPTGSLDIEIVSLGELLHSEFLKTRPLDLNYMTRQGREVPLTPIRLAES